MIIKFNDFKGEKEMIFKIDDHKPITLKELMKINADAAGVSIEEVDTVIPLDEIKKMEIGETLDIECSGEKIYSEKDFNILCSVGGIGKKISRVK